MKYAENGVRQSVHTAHMCVQVSGKNVVFKSVSECIQSFHNVDADNVEWYTHHRVAIATALESHLRLQMESNAMHIKSLSTCCDTVVTIVHVWLFQMMHYYYCCCSYRSPGCFSLQIFSISKCDYEEGAWEINININTNIRRVGNAMQLI